MEREELLRAEELRQAASRLVEIIRFPEWISHFGEIEPAGSYALDLMTWPDLDCTCRLKPGVEPEEALWEWVRLAQRRLSWRKFNFQKFSETHKLYLPRGIYLGAQLSVPECGGMWKVDLWCLSPDSQREAEQRLGDLQSRLTPALRERLLRLKHELMAGTSRTPQQASHWLYQAVLKDGLESREEIFAYLRAHGVALPDMLP